MDYLQQLTRFTLSKYEIRTLYTLAVFRKKNYTRALDNDIKIVDHCIVN